ncbi:MAG: 23S rRNA (guanosine(2251)-2'-O)-methyltransferase RlmB [Bacillati bacterium ANGP1]|uniref:23S rRNA (Guanosine(2251)-2'-O)-methyltransferase RlmB n=1 Tax=Candidatus Segetimicrobium genomatis TaxID=2569760 RepID=A0A537IZ64_9BACT|nr:MAG: 23S rRNA (guanosine(2251)-2'-O)-methyltransferase RlmB [Terrabacteria group bacterium ANGP1]
MPPGHERSDAGGNGDAIPGRRAVLEALRARRPLRKILIGRTTHGGTIRDILEEARRQDIVVQFVDGRRLDSLTHAARHQGVVALTSARPLVSVEDVLAAARTRQQPPFILVLDGVEDPANLGAIIRTAEGAGVHGVIIPKHRATGLTPAVAKTSAGALEYLPVAQVTNLVRTLDELKEAGLWVAGADPTAKDVYHRTRLLPPLALVMGGEGKGLGRLVREHCDILVRLPMRGRIASLNVAVAAGVLLYEVVRQMETGGSQ